jgi:hypothetical protein
MLAKKSITSGALALALLLGTSGCYTMTHTVGKGAQGNNKHEKRIWFALWGLVPISDFDSQELAGDAKDYTVQTQASPLDILINIFTLYITIGSRTVTVTQ